MLRSEYKDGFLPFLRKISRNENVEISDSKALLPPNLDLLESHKSEIPSDLFEYLNYRDGFLVKWEEKNGNGETWGRINLLPVARLFDETAVDLKAVANEFVFNEQPERKEVTGFFRPVDFFVDEACVGFFSEYGSRDVMYYYDFGISFYSLRINFEGYYKLLTESCGYAYWQQALLVREYDYPTDAEDRFKEDMQRLFPHFDYAEFLDLYDSLKVE